MKNMLLFMALLPALGGQYNCFSQCNYIVDRVDEFTNVKETWLKLETVGRGMKAHLAKVDSNIILVVYAKVGCVTKESKIYLKLDDGQILEYLHFGDIDCKQDLVPAGALIPPHDIETLKNRKVLKMRLSGSEGYYDTDLKNPDFVKVSLGCL
jgi:hypothetical protein